MLAGHTADAAILTEPTRGAVWTAQVGVLWFQVHVLGAPAHAGEATSGANAIEASAAVIGALRSLEAELNAVRPPLYAAHPHPIHFNVGMIDGGDWPSTVAGECRSHCRLALYPGERVAGLKERVEATVAGAVAQRPELAAFDVEVVYEGFQCEGYELAHDAPLVTSLADTCERAVGHRPPLLASTATTDARAFQLYGDTPAVCFGPYAEHAHGVDERVHLPSVTETAQVIALFIRGLVRPGGLMPDAPPLRLPDPCLVVLVGATAPGSRTGRHAWFDARPDRVVRPPAGGGRGRRARPAGGPRRVRGARPDRRQAAGAAAHHRHRHDRPRRQAARGVAARSPRATAWPPTPSCSTRPRPRSAGATAPAGTPSPARS